MASEVGKAIKDVAARVDLKALANRSVEVARRPETAEVAAGALTVALVALKGWNEARHGEGQSLPFREAVSEARAGLSRTTLPKQAFRRSVIAVTQPGTELSAVEDGAGVAWLQVPDRVPSQGLVRRLMQEGMLVPGTVLIQSPIEPNQYFTLEQAATGIATQTLSAYERVASLLGATSFSVKAVKIWEEGRGVSLNADGSLPRGALKGNVGRDVTEKLESLVTISSKNASQEPDLAAAEAVAAGYGMESDETIKTLLDFVRDGVPKTEFTREVALKHESSRALETGLKVQSKLKTHLKVDGKAERSVLTDVSVKLQVNFKD